MQNDFRTVLENVPIENVCFQEPIKNHTYTKLGGISDLFLTPSSYDEIQFIMRTAKQYNIPITLLGKGSNLIVRDGGIRGITLSLTKMKSIHVSSDYVIAQGGAAIIDVSEKALEHALSGLEFACGIPGTVGGALYMNAGAYGGQISDVLEKTTILTENGEIVTLSKDEFGFGYRESIFRKHEYVILEARFKLEVDAPDTIRNKMSEFTLARNSKQPLEYPSCGSVFKRPPGYYGGKLIQDAGLQGTRIGGAEVSKKHAGFIVNIDQATAKDYIDLISYVQQTIKEKFDVELETEVIILGEDN
nr:UDP-N-acetylmuramate dehydrogenase [Bacillus sp. PS06]